MKTYNIHDIKCSHDLAEFEEGTTRYATEMRDMDYTIEARKTGDPIIIDFIKDFQKTHRI